MNHPTNDLYPALRKTVFLGVALLALLWFLFTIREVLLLFLFAASLAVVLNSPVTWLEQKGLKRTPALLLVLGIVLLVLGLFAVLLVPRLLNDLTILLGNLPGYFDSLRDRLLSFLEPYPGLRQNLGMDTDQPSSGLPSVSILVQSLLGVGQSAVGWLAILLLLSSVILYMTAYPAPLLQSYLQLLPAGRREQGTRAFIRAREMIVGWASANVIAGALEAGASAVVLSILGVPGALVWAALSFFAELVPRLGLYLMMIPPALVALSVDPLKALWVVLFYLAMDQAMGNLILPRLQQETMDLHPVLILFAIFALAAAFGIVGALLAVPLAAILKAYYQTFFLDSQPDDADLNDQVQRMLRGGAADEGEGH